MKNNILEIQNLTKYYGKILGVENLSLQLKEGEIFGFIGPNGAGKSTTIRSIMNLINKTSGKVLIENKEFNKDNIEIFCNISGIKKLIQVIKTPKKIIVLVRRDKPLDILCFSFLFFIIFSTNRSKTF